VACIVASDDSAAERVASALPEAAGAEGIVSGVFVGKGGPDELHEVVFVGLIDECVPVVAAVSGCSLMKLGRVVGGLIVASDGGWEKDRGVVEAVLGCGEKFLFDGLGRKVDVCADSAEVGKDAEDAFGLLALALCGFYGGVVRALLGLLCLGSIRIIRVGERRR